MNGVLPKPFTKEGMLRALEKHLPQFKKEAPFPPPPPGQMPLSGGFVTPGVAHTPLGLTMGQLPVTQGLKEEQSPGKSPLTATAWHSPNHLPGASPLSAGGYMQPMADNRQFNMTPTHPHPQSGFPAPNPRMVGPGVSTPVGAQHRRGMSDMTTPDDHLQDPKRQRMYPPPPGYAPQ